MVNRAQKIGLQAKRARSLKGALLPTTVIDSLLKIAEQNDEYDFFIGSAHILSRRKAFFIQNRKVLNFFNQNGEPFDFDKKAIRRNDLFFAIHFMEETKEAFVYVYFPFDSAFR